MNKIIMILIMVSVCTTKAYSHSIDCFDVHVSIQDHKVDEKSWDGGLGSEPDLKLCIIDSHGYRCFVDTTDFDDHKSLCENSYECDLGVKELPDEIFKVEVYDIDIKNDDLIGRLECRRGVECLVGLSKVTFKSSSCESDQSSANKSMHPTAKASAD